MLGSQGHAVSGLGLGNSEARSRVCLQGQLLTEDSGRESFAMFLRMFLFPRVESGSRRFCRNMLGSES